MSDGNGQGKRPTMDDHWLLDHHIEEMLDSFDDAARVRDGAPDADLSASFGLNGFASS